MSVVSRHLFARVRRRLSPRAPWVQTAEPITEVGKLIVRATNDLEKTSPELVRKLPNTVFEDADLETTTPGAPALPFGGDKTLRLGPREGRRSARAYTETKAVCLQL